MAPFIYNQAQNILSKLPGKDGHEGCPIYVRRLQYTVLTLKAILLDAEEKQERDRKLHDRLKELQNVFHQIEDTMDEFKWEDIGKKVRIAYKSQRAHKIRKLCEHLDRIAAKLYEFHLTESHKAHLACTRMKTIHSFLSATEFSARLIKPNWQLLYPLIGSPVETPQGQLEEILNKIENSKGRNPVECPQGQHDGTLNKIENSMESNPVESPQGQHDGTLNKIENSMESNPVESPQGQHDGILNIIKSTAQFFLIYGDAGTGKSTLAKVFYNDKGVVQYFPTRFWVCVKEDFDTRRLIKEVLGFAIGEEIHDDLDDRQLLFKVEQSLSGKPLLLVFQDLSRENLNDLSMFEEFAWSIRDGCKIIVTTQNSKLAEEIRRQKSQKIWELTEDNSIALLKKHAFGDAQHVKNPELTKIAKQIAEKYKKFPLAMKCLGGLLSSKTTTVEWKKVKDKIWAEKDGNILPVLRLCYDLMPSHLKRCFLLCSQLPNDQFFSSNDLIQLWMAHGLLNSLEEKNLSLENIGEKYFKELWSRCFFHDIEEYGLGYWFKLHPLIRKLACIVAEEQAECLVGTKEIPKRRFIAFGVREMVPPSESLVNECISRFESLRLLYLGDTDLKEIPNAIGTLKRLRYLDLQGNKRIERLPNSICDLQCLQTLILASCSKLEKLPKDIRNLISLRYLWVTSNQLCLQKNGVGILTSLRFLAIGGCKDECLQNLFEKVQCLTALETLMIYDCKTLESLPDGIRFLKSLQNLVIWGCKKLKLTLEKVEFSLQRFTIRDLPKVDELPQWLQGSATTLRILDIINCPIAVNTEDLSESYEAIERVGIHGVVRDAQSSEGNNLVHANQEIRLKKV